MTSPTPDAPNDPDGPRLQSFTEKYPTYDARAKFISEGLGIGDRGGNVTGAHSYEWNLAYNYYFGAYDPLRYEAAMKLKDGNGSLGANDPLLRQSNPSWPSVQQRAAMYRSQNYDEMQQTASMYGLHQTPQGTFTAMHVASMFGHFAAALTAPGVHVGSDPDAIPAPPAGGSGQGQPELPPTAAPGVHVDQQV